MRKLTVSSSRKLLRLFQDDDAQGFVNHCLDLILRGFDLGTFFEGGEEAFCDIVERGLALHTQAHSGFLYLAANPVYGVNVYKIGLTRKAPDERRGTLRTSGVLGEFILAAHWPSQDVARSEARAKAYFSSIRLASSEFFHADYRTLMSGLESVLAQEATAFKTLQRLIIAHA